MRRRFQLLQACCAVSLGMVAPGIAVAQTNNANGANAANNDEIVVTATHREQSIHDVPFSVNAQTQEDIQRTGSQNLEDLSRNVAGMSVQNLGPGQSQVAIRGVSAGQIVRDQPGVKEQVGVYLDESVISLSLFTPDLDLYDLNRVETLRGPQGTLFGSGSVGGTIRYITNQPNLDHFEGSIEGNVNTVTDGGMGGSLKGMINQPLSPGRAAVRAVGYYTAYPGFIDALHTDGSRSSDVNDGYRAGGRIALTLRPTDNITITPRVLYQDIDVNGFNREEVFNLYGNAFTTPPVNFDDRQQLLRMGEEFRDRTGIADLTATIDFGGVELTSVTGYTHRDILVSRDASALTGSVSVDLGGAFLPGGALLVSNLRDTTKLEQWTQELRLASTAPGPVRWLVGAYYSNADRNYNQRLPTPGYDFYTDARFGAGTSAAVDNGFGLIDNPYHADLPYNDTQLAIFGEGSVDLTDRTTVTLGGRYYDFNEERSFHSGGLFSNGDNRTDKTSSSGFSPRLLLSYDLSDDIILNAQVSEGFRLGGTNDPLNLPLCSPADAATFGGFPSYNDETSVNHEIGFKYSHAGLTFNGAAFYDSIHNLQVSADAGSCSSRVVFNVANAHTVGIEAELSAMPMEGLELSLAGSLVESQFDSSLVSSGGAVIAGIREGSRLPSTPNYQIAATAAYYWDVSGFGSGSQAHVAVTAQTMGSRFTQPADQEPGAGVFVSHLPFGGASGLGATVLDLELDPFTIVNLNAGIENDSWAMQVYVNNVTDENAHLAFDRERGGRARLGFHTNQPRTIGVTVRRNF